MVGNPCHADHLTGRFWAAWTASHSFLATTPRKLPSRTTRTPRGGFPWLINWEPMPVGRMTRPWSIPGTRTSWMNVNCPVTLSGMSMRGRDLPTTVYCAGFLGVPFPPVTTTPRKGADVGADDGPIGPAPAEVA